ncbi:ATP-binding protein [Nocardia sp. NPDC005825]|uniref:HD domain-containing protein n=1 Tax=unclassified Nocardia TaxID=2637762 RepID=UPI0033DCE24F
MASMLTGAEFPINPAEAFVLGGAFLIHDLGMGIQAYDDGLKGIAGLVEWLDLLARLYPDDYAELQDGFRRDIEKNPNWDGLTDSRVKSALTSFLRWNHAERADTILAQEWSLSNGQKFYLIADTDLRFRYSELIGKIARSHWLDVNSLPDIFRNTLGAPAGYPVGWTIDPLKLACLMRLADAAHIDSRRADPLHTPHRNPQGASRDHWKFQERMLHPHIEGRRLVYTSASALGSEDSDAWWLAYETAKAIDGELRSVDALCGDLGKPRFSVYSVAGVDSPERFSRFVSTAGWRPVDASPHISDPSRIISTLGGFELYGHDDGPLVVPVREILANALDATRARRHGLGQSRMQPIEVVFGSTDQWDYVSVRDYGVGMTETEIVNYLCNFGTSGWRGQEIAHLMPGVLAHGFSPTGRFGIGFFSVFMIADDVIVTTRSIRGSWDDTVVLEFKGGPLSRPVLREARTNERLIDPGTKVEIRLKLRFGDGSDLVRISGMETSTSEIGVRFIRKLALMADEDIWVTNLGGSEMLPAVVRNEWRSMSGVQLFDALNPGLEFLEEPEVFERAGSLFGSGLYPLLNSKGDCVGRIGFGHTPLGLQSSLNWEVGAEYAGGLLANDAGLYLWGIIDGSPARASRDRVRLELTLDDMQTWFRGCKSKVDISGVSDYHRGIIQSIGVYFGIRSEDLPLAYGNEGHLCPSELAEYCASRDEVIILDHMLENIFLGEEEYTCVRYGGRFFIPSDGQIVVSDNHMSDNLYTLPSRPWDLGATLDVNDSPELRWWLWERNSLLGEVVRVVAESWEMSLRDVLVKSERCQMDGSVDNRVLAAVVGGGFAPIGALRLRRV